MNDIIAAVDGLYRIIRLQPFRRTEGVRFDVLSGALVPKVDAIDRVLHDHGALSPGPVGSVDRPWYMHPFQDDHLFVLAGERHVDIYTHRHGRVEQFVVTPQEIWQNGHLLYDGPALLIWPRHVFHRIISGPEGSASVNLATHYEGFDIRTNFNIYDLDPESGEFSMIREGYRDQANSG